MHEGIQPFPVYVHHLVYGHLVLQLNQFVYVYLLCDMLELSVVLGLSLMHEIGCNDEGLGRVVQEAPDGTVRPQQQSVVYDPDLHGHYLDGYA